MKRFAILILAAVFSIPALAASETDIIKAIHAYPYLSYSYLGYSAQLSRVDKTSDTVIVDFQAFLRRVGATSSNQDQ
ncbi:hypothetical protein [Nitrosospira sp. NpAV]|uniref:hypothetical protein n=1 Tax=Nitrosospira sp. NpAV TaxID=58133 RepID=UPI000695EA9A|nr:hypothetical protein [Nitrosospira sp. NpAV]